jgi:hypothetical protein
MPQRFLDGSPLCCLTDDKAQNRLAHRIVRAHNAGIHVMRHQAHHTRLYSAGRSRWTRLARSSLLAWVASIVLHAALFLFLYDIVLREAAQPRRVVIPEARLVEAAGPLHLPPAILELSRQTIPIPAAAPLPLDHLPPVSAPIESLSALPAGWETATPTTPPAGLASGVVPAVSLFGQAGNAYRVVYVVDVSASLMIYLDDVVRELRRSIRDLLPTQRFHIVLARPEDSLNRTGLEELAAGRLVPANGQHKAEAMTFLDGITVEAGEAMVNKAMRRALEVGPELIYFLTDGDFQDDLEQELERLKAPGVVKITVIGFEPAPEPAKRLERVARRHGGNYRVVTAR